MAISRIKTIPKTLLLLPILINSHIFLYFFCIYYPISPRNNTSGLMFQTRLYWFLSWYFFSSTISHFHDELPLSIEVTRSFGTLSIRCVFVLLEPQSDKIPNNKTEQYTFSKSLNKWQQITHLTQRSQNKSWILKSLNFYSYISNCGHCRITTCKIPIKFCYSVNKTLSNIYSSNTTTKSLSGHWQKIV